MHIWVWRLAKNVIGWWLCKKIGKHTVKCNRNLATWPHGIETKKTTIMSKIAHVKIIVFYELWYANYTCVLCVAVVDRGRASAIARCQNRALKLIAVWHAITANLFPHSSSRAICSMNSIWSSLVRRLFVFELQFQRKLCAQMHFHNNHNNLASGGK